VHHGANEAYRDKNYGGAVIVFDRLSGAFAAERAAEPVRYGLVHPPGSKNPFVLALGERRRPIGRHVEPFYAPEALVFGAAAAAPSYSLRRRSPACQRLNAVTR
jgi:hypothetical protein